MVIGIIGENCTGKSTLAEEIRRTFGAEIITGKDYLRMAKSETEAAALFAEKLRNTASEKYVVYVISEPEQLRLLPDHAVRVLVSADIETIKARFRDRMHGNLPEPVEKMLERKHGMFDSVSCDCRYDGVTGDPAHLCEELRVLAGKSSGSCEEG